MSSKVRKCIVVLVLAVILAAGIVYGYSRDLYKGNNKIYVQPDGATGQVAVTETVTQNFVPGHDYDGISLLIDHTRAADLGTVHVSVYRAADDALVLERSLPVVLTTRERYTFLASNETIEAEAGEVFRAEIEYRGPASGLVTAATGEMPAEVASSCAVGGAEAGVALALGVVTDYQYTARNCWLIVVASVIFVIAIGALSFQWGELRGNTRRGKVTFLGAYFAIITALFVFSLTMTESAEYTTISLGDEATGSVSLRDGEKVDAYITLPEENVCGVQIPVERPAYSYIDETLTVQVLDATSNRQLQTATIPIADINGEQVYLPLEDRYAAGTRLRLHFTTSGMIYAESLHISTTTASDTDSQIYQSGTLQNGQICGTVYSYTMVSDTSREIRLYAEAIAIGLVLAWLLLRRDLPLHLPMRRTEEISAPAKKSSWRRTIAWLAATLVCGAIIIDYVWAEGVGYVQDRVWVEMASYPADLSNDWVTIPADGEITQSFEVTENAFCGVALMIADESKESVEDVADSAIRVGISDAQGTMLDEVSCKVGDLSLISELLGKDNRDNTILTKQNMFYYVPFHDDLEVHTGTTYTLHISQSAKNETPILISENVYQEAHLMTTYHQYAALLIPLFVFSMLVLLGAVCVLSVVASRGLTSPMVSFVILAIAGGIVLSLAIPALSIADGMAHTKYLYLMSNQLSGVYDVAGPGRFYMLASDADYCSPISEKIAIEHYQRVFHGLFARNVQNGLYTGIGSRNLESLATIWTYLPSLIGFQLARMSGLTLTTVVMIAKWCNMIGALLLTCYAIRRTPTGKYGWMIIALFPGVLQYTASVSYDAMINAFTILFVANTLHLIYDEDRSAFDYMVTMYAAMLLLNNKSGIYLPITFIVFIPVIKRLLHWNRWVFIVGLVAGAAVVLYLGIQHTASITSWTNPDIYTVADIIHDPMNFVHMIENTMVLRGDTVFTQIVGSGLGARQVVVPTWIIAGICILLYLAWRAEPQNALRIGNGAALYIAALVLGNILLLLTCWMVVETYRTDTVIGSFQSKYQLPILILANVVAVHCTPRREVATPQRLIHLMSLAYMACVGAIFVYVFGVSMILR